MEKIHYNEHIRSHNPKSIYYWTIEGIIIDGKRWMIQEFRDKEDALYVVLSDEYYNTRPNYYEHKLVNKLSDEFIKEFKNALAELKQLRKDHDDLSKDVHKKFKEIENKLKEHGDKLKELEEALANIKIPVYNGDGSVVKVSVVDELNRLITVDGRNLVNDQFDNDLTEFVKVDENLKNDGKIGLNKKFLDRVQKAEDDIVRIDNKPDKDTTYSAGSGLKLDETTFSVDPNSKQYGSPKKSLNNMADDIKALQEKPDKDTTYTGRSPIQINSNNEISLVGHPVSSVLKDQDGTKLTVNGDEILIPKQYIQGRNIVIPLDRTVNGYGIEVHIDQENNPHSEGSITITKPDGSNEIIHVRNPLFLRSIDGVISLTVDNESLATEMATLKRDVGNILNTIPTVTAEPLKHGIAITVNGDRVEHQTVFDDNTMFEEIDGTIGAKPYIAGKGVSISDDREISVSLKKLPNSTMYPYIMADNTVQITNGVSYGILASKNNHFSSSTTNWKLSYKNKADTTLYTGGSKVVIQIKSITVESTYPGVSQNYTNYKIVTTGYNNGSTQLFGSGETAFTGFSLRLTYQSKLESGENRINAKISCDVLYTNPDTGAKEIHTVELDRSHIENGEPFGVIVMKDGIQVGTTEIILDTVVFEIRADREVYSV